MTTAALCQCAKCLSYLADNRPTLPVGSGGTTSLDHFCTTCGGNRKLAQIRGTLTDPLNIECLSLLSEECAEAQQRVGKIMRWGWDADFEGTTQQHKLELELGDILAAISIALENGLVDPDNIQAAMLNKLAKLREDAAGPHQRLLHARVPNAQENEYGQAKWLNV